LIGDLDMSGITKDNREISATQRELEWFRGFVVEFFGAYKLESSWDEFMVDDCCGIIPRERQIYLLNSSRAHERSMRQLADTYQGKTGLDWTVKRGF